jgi:hypothetical protein
MGTLLVGTDDVQIWVPIPEQREGESAIEAYRRTLVRVRDALTKAIDDQHGVRL